MAYDDKEKQKQYNKEYYENNKDEINKKISAKEICKYCNRSVRHDNLFKHMKSNYCKSRRELFKMIDDEEK